MDTNESNAQKYWESNPDAMYSETTWISYPPIPQRIYSKISDGTNAGRHWLNWTLDTCLNRKFKRAISPGCGSGGHEILMLQSGFVEKVDAFDFSSVSVESANKKALDAGIEGLNAYIGDLNTFKLPKDTYDLALFAGSLHHVNNLENCLLQIQNGLVEDGVLIVWEYVGPCYLLWRDQQISLINKLLKSIPDEFKKSPGIELKKTPIQQQLAADHSEATRSALIIDFIKEYFDIFYYRECGGTILHPLYPLLNHERIIKDDTSARMLVDMIATMEEVAIENKILSSDFVFLLARPKKK